MFEIETMCKASQLISSGLITLALVGHTGRSLANEVYTLVCDLTVSYTTGEPRPLEGTSVKFTIEDTTNGPVILGASFCGEKDIEKSNVTDGSFYFLCVQDWGNNNFVNLEFFIDRHTGVIQYFMGDMHWTGTCQKGVKQF